MANVVFYVKTGIKIFGHQKELGLKSKVVSDSEWTHASSVVGKGTQFPPIPVDVYSI